MYAKWAVIFVYQFQIESSGMDLAQTYFLRNAKERERDEKFAIKFGTSWHLNILLQIVIYNSRHKIFQSKLSNGDVQQFSIGNFVLKYFSHLVLIKIL